MDQCVSRIEYSLPPQFAIARADTSGKISLNIFYSKEWIGQAKMLYNDLSSVCNWFCKSFSDAPPTQLSLRLIAYLFVYCFIHNYFSFYFLFCVLGRFGVFCKENIEANVMLGPLEAPDEASEDLTEASLSNRWLVR